MAKNERVNADGVKLNRKGKPKKTRWYHQVWQAYKLAKEYDPLVTLWLIVIFVGILAVAIGAAVIFNLPWWYTLLLGLPLALLSGMFYLGRRAERAAFSQLEGQAGASRAALSVIRRGWTFGDEPVAINPRSQDLVFRGVGKPGVVLVGEGNPRSLRRLLVTEQKRTQRALGEVPVYVLEVGNGPDQLSLQQLPKAVKKLPNKLTKAELAAVLKRLTSLRSNAMPIPKGVDPMRARPNRRAMRG